MKIHPKISKYIKLLKEAGITKVENNEKEVLTLLKRNGATQTEAIIVLHLGLNIGIGESEKIVFPSNVWERESLQDIAYQTFLYMNYNPDNPNFYYDEDSLKFSLIPPPEDE
jgi:hypothetical protein